MSKVGGAGLAVMFMGMIVLLLVLSIAYPAWNEEPVSQRKLLIYTLAVIAVALMALGAALLALSFDLDDLRDMLRECRGPRENRGPGGMRSD